jgi:hypothetical protein
MAPLHSAYRAWQLVRSGGDAAPSGRSCGVGPNHCRHRRKCGTLNLRFKYAAMTTLIVSAFSVLPGGALASAAAATPDVPILPIVSRQTAEEHARPLLELVTSDLRGRFYTLNQDEAEEAAREHGFKRTDESEGITMFNRELEGTFRCTVSDCGMGTMRTCWRATRTRSAG